MLDKPKVPDEDILQSLRGYFGIDAQSLSFLPLGADPHTAVYKALDRQGRTYFIKLRLGNFQAFCVDLPVFLRSQGITEVISPLPARDGRYWAEVGEVRLIVYPFIDGMDGYETELTQGHWLQLGCAMRKVHSLVLPEEIKRQIQEETYSDHYRKVLDDLLEWATGAEPADPFQRDLRQTLRLHRELLLDLRGKAERLASELSRAPREYVLCHADLHAGNVFIDNSSGELYIIDWDDPVLAPKERDLMFPGGAQGFRGFTPQEEEALFFRGYGKVQVNMQALVYYRVERVIIDIAIFGEDILNLEKSPENRRQALKYLESNFEPGGTIEQAMRSF